MIFNDFLSLSDSQPRQKEQFHSVTSLLLRLDTAALIRFR